MLADGATLIVKASSLFFALLLLLFPGHVLTACYGTILLILCIYGGILLF